MKNIITVGNLKKQLEKYNDNMEIVIVDSNDFKNYIEKICIKKCVSTYVNSNKTFEEKKFTEYDYQKEFTVDDNEDLIEYSNKIGNNFLIIECEIFSR